MKGLTNFIFVFHPNQNDIYIFTTAAFKVSGLQV